MVMHRDLLLRHRNPLYHRRSFQSKPPLHDWHVRGSRRPYRSRRHCLFRRDSLCSLPRRLQFPSLPPHPRQSKRRHIALITARREYITTRPTCTGAVHKGRQRAGMATPTQIWIRTDREQGRRTVFSRRDLAPQPSFFSGFVKI